MAFHIIWSQTAAEDLKEIVLFIAGDNKDAAAGLAERIFHHIERAAEMPFSNRVVPEKSELSIRESILKPYRIIYKVDSDRNAIYILRIWHAYRGMPDLG